MNKFFISLLLAATLLSIMPTQGIARTELERGDVLFSVSASSEKKTLALMSVEVPRAGVWDIGFNLSGHTIAPKDASTHQNLDFIKQEGGFYVIRFNVTDPRYTKQYLNLEIIGPPLRKESDAPTGFFLVEKPTSSTPKVIPVDASLGVVPWEPTPADSNAEQNREKENTSIENNPTQTSLTAENSLIVPLPVKLERNAGNFIFTQNTQLLYAASNNNDAKIATEFFRDAIKPAMGYSLPITQYTGNNDTIPNNSILLTSTGVERYLTTPAQLAEGYAIEVTSGNNPGDKTQQIKIYAKTGAGFFYALQSLRQLMPAQIYQQTPVAGTIWQIPNVQVVDYPRFGYRGQHLDVARHFMNVTEVKRFLDLMAVHKLNYFEWHLTDDEGWRIEIKNYPQLTLHGSTRGYNPAPHKNPELDLYPAFGSGAAPYGDYYTQGEIRDIVQYAQARHITIVPEIDMPGHARAMLMSMPAQLKDPEDISSYTSIQGYHDNILSPCLESTYTVIGSILGEVSTLFPGPYIHIGGDEVPANVWSQSPACIKLAQEKWGITPADSHYKDKLQNYFMTQIQQRFFLPQGQMPGSNATPKIMAGWEEIADPAGELTAPLLVYLWNTPKTDQVEQKATEYGYDVILAPAENLYFDLAYTANPKEPGQYWAGYVDTFKPYVFKPLDPTSHPYASDKIIKGVQGQLWSEQIPTQKQLDYFGFPKISALAELAWTPGTCVITSDNQAGFCRNWHNFYDRMVTYHLPRLQQYGVQYRDKEFKGE